jgi:hypothetical protein
MGWSVAMAGCFGREVLQQRSLLLQLLNSLSGHIPLKCMCQMLLPSTTYCKPELMTSSSLQTRVKSTIHSSRCFFGTHGYSPALFKAVL